MTAKYPRRYISSCPICGQPVVALVERHKVRRIWQYQTTYKEILGRKSHPCPPLKIDQFDFLSPADFEKGKPKPTPKRRRGRPRKNDRVDKRLLSESVYPEDECELDRDDEMLFDRLIDDEEMI